MATFPEDDDGHSGHTMDTGTALWNEDHWDGDLISL